MIPLPHRRAAPPRRPARAAFTLIEVMVATGILMILVLVVGGVFTQASAAWDAGYARAEGGMIARSIVGAVQRDLQTAIDGRPFKGLGFGDDPIELSDKKAKFVAFLPRDPSRRGDRGLHLIEYTVGAGGVTRTDSLVVWNNGQWKTDNPKTSQLYTGTTGSEGTTGADETSTQNSSSFSVRGISFVSDDAASDSARSTFQSQRDFGDHVSWTGTGRRAWGGVYVAIDQSGAYAGLEVRSFGKDGKHDEEGTYAGGEGRKKGDDIISH
jgi:hypothetical protein